MSNEANNVFFELHEYVREFGKFSSKAVHELVRRKDPILSQIPIVEVDEVPITQYNLPSGETLEIEPQDAPGTAEMRTDDLLSGDLTSYYVFIDEIAESMLPEVKKQFYAHFESVCDGYGQTISAKGQPFSYELLIQMLDKKQMEFDENGDLAEGEMIVLNPLTMEEFRKLPPMTPEQEKAWSELMNKKRQEFYDRKRFRKLS